MVCDGCQKRSPSKQMRKVTDETGDEFWYCQQCRQNLEEAMALRAEQKKTLCPCCHKTRKIANLKPYDACVCTKYNLRCPPCRERMEKWKGRYDCDDCGRFYGGGRYNVPEQPRGDPYLRLGVPVRGETTGLGSFF